MPRSTQTLIIKWTSTRSLFYAIKYHKADNKVVKIRFSTKFVKKYWRPSALHYLCFARYVSKRRRFHCRNRQHFLHCVCCLKPIYLCFVYLLLKIKAWLLGWCRQRALFISVTKGPGDFSNYLRLDVMFVAAERCL